jgi:electron transfer flavoprotein alpha subunit
MSSAKGVWVLVEKDEEGMIEDFSLEILSEGRRFANELGQELSVLMFSSHNEETVDILASYGTDNAYFFHSSLLADNHVELCEESLFQLVEEKKPVILLFGASLFGNDVASRLAAHLKTGLVSDCVGLSLNEEGLLVQTKLTYGSKIAVIIISPISRPQIATVKPGILQKRMPEGKRETKVMTFSPELTGKTARLKFKGVVKADPGKISLDEAEIIVSGGRGMGSKENFEILRELARNLSGVVAGSLGAVDDELVPRKNLVGQTGATVKPKLYVACGISGSIYHVLGMKDSDVIIAINKDRFAPIFKYSDMGLIGDVVEIVPALTNRVRQALKNSGEGKNGQWNKEKF